MRPTQEELEERNILKSKFTSEFSLINYEQRPREGFEINLNAKFENWLIS